MAEVQRLYKRPQENNHHKKALATAGTIGVVSALYVANHIARHRTLTQRAFKLPSRAVMKQTAPFN